MYPEEISEKYKNKDWLYDQYIVQDKTIKQIAEEFSFSKSNVARYKDRFGLRKKKVATKKNTYADRDWLSREYIIENKTAIQIAEESGVNRSTIFEYLNRFQIEKSEEDKIVSISDRVKDISIQKYGVTHFNSSKEVIAKKEETNLKRYGNKTFLGSEAHKEINKDLILIENKTPYEWAKDIGVSDIILYRWIKDNPQHSDSEFKKFVGNYKPNISNLENILMQEMEIEIYNKYFDLVHYPSLKYKPDFKLSDSIAINVDGLYWHSNIINKDNKYHFNMRKEYEDLGLRIFQFRGDEILHKLPIVKSIINHKLGISNRIFARKTDLKFVNQSEANEFLNKNHLMGTTKARHIGLYYNDELSMIFSFKIKQDTLKVERLCSNLDTVVVGGFSKLLSYCVSNLEFKHIDYWTDLRYGNAKYLEKHGFIHQKDVLGWKWTDFKLTYNRLKCRANMDERGLTEKEHAKELGWVKIYDAGQRLYRK